MEGSLDNCAPELENPKLPKSFQLSYSVLILGWGSTGSIQAHYFCFPPYSTDNEMFYLQYSKVFLQLKFGSGFLFSSNSEQIKLAFSFPAIDPANTVFEIACFAVLPWKCVSVWTWTHNVTLKDITMASRHIWRCHVGSCKQLFWKYLDWVLYISEVPWEPEHRQWVVISSDDMQGTSCHWHTGNWMSQQSQGLHVLDCALLTSPITLL